MVAKTVKDALVIPAAALFKNRGGRGLRDGGGVGRKGAPEDVKVGIRNGDDAQIVSGLDAGEKVITTGGYGLPDKTQIKLQEAAPAKEAAATTRRARRSDESDKSDDDEA